MKEDFDIDKKNILSKKDKSKKGSIDKPIIKLIDFLNKLNNYYTTSSCSGRILILKIPEDGRKDHVEWLMTSHKPINFEMAKEALLNLKDDNAEIWFKQEPLILHAVARTLEDAQKLLDIAKLSGFKKSGIIASRRRLVVEIEGTDILSTIIGKGNELFINNDYLNILIKTANKKLLRNLNKKDKLTENIKKEFKENN